MRNKSSFAKLLITSQLTIIAALRCAHLRGCHATYGDHHKAIFGQNLDPADQHGCVRFHGGIRPSESHQEFSPL
jgi:hypothetical protein